MKTKHSLLISTSTAWGLALLGRLLGAQAGPFSPNDWPPSVNPNVPVDYGIFDPTQNLNTPPGWNNTITQAGGGDQWFQSVTIGGLTGDQQGGAYVNIADSNFASWTNTPVLDILLEVFGNGALYNADGSPINTTWLEGTLLSAGDNLLAVNAGPTPLGLQGNQWNWLLLEITNPISAVTGQRYVGYLPTGRPRPRQPGRGEWRDFAPGECLGPDPSGRRDWAAGRVRCL